MKVLSKIVQIIWKIVKRKKPNNIGTKVTIKEPVSSFIFSLPLDQVIFDPESYAWVTVLVKSERLLIPCCTICFHWAVPEKIQKKCRNIMQLLSTPEFTKRKPKNWKKILWLLC